MKIAKPVLTWAAVLRAAVIASVATVIALAWEFPSQRKAIIKVVLFVLIVFVATMLAEIIADLIEVGITRAFPELDMEEEIKDKLLATATASANQKPVPAIPEA